MIGRSASHKHRHSRHNASRSPSGRQVLVALGLVVLLVVVYLVVQLLRPVANPSASASLPGTITVPGTAPRVADVPGTETTIVLEGGGTLASLGGTTPRPIASITKIMTSMVILADHPLKPGANGPSITITPADVTTYDQEKAADDSVAAVAAGEHLSERQALEALLIPSADNVAELLATWDAGSEQAFVAKMNARAKTLGMTHTHYTGPSGVQPTTVSDAADEAHLAQLAMANPTFASIVAMPQVVLPVAGLQYNVDADLGHDGIVGVKTGWVPAGGASFVFAAHHSVAGHTETLVGAIVGETAVPALPHVLSEAEHLSTSISATLAQTSVLRNGAVVGALHAASGTSDPVVAKGSVALITWPGAHVFAAVHFERHLRAPLAAGTQVGTVTVSFGTEIRTLPAVLSHALAGPSLGWRLSRV